MLVDVEVTGIALRLTLEALPETRDGTKRVSVGSAHRGARTAGRRGGLWDTLGHAGCLPRACFREAAAKFTTRLMMANEKGPAAGPRTDTGYGISLRVIRAQRRCRTALSEAASTMVNLLRRRP